MTKIRNDSVVGLAIQHGRELGREEARQALRSVLQELLTIEFGEVPQSVVDKINKCNQLDQLCSAVLRAYKLHSPEELVVWLEPSLWPGPRQVRFLSTYLNIGVSH